MTTIHIPTTSGNGLYRVKSLIDLSEDPLLESYQEAKSGGETSAKTVVCHYMQEYFPYGSNHDSIAMCQ